MHLRSAFKALPALLALALLSGHSFFSSAASYYRTSLQDMTTRASAVVEVNVLSRTYPAMPDDQFQRTHVQVAVTRNLKGALPENITLDLPGGVRGNQVFLVADSADFQIGERAMVFVKEPQPGQYMVQDLGLGKFNIVTRDGLDFVESPLCPKAMRDNAGADASLLTKSIPYDAFCTLVSSYAKNEEPRVSPLKLAMNLQNSTSHVCDPNKPCSISADALRMADAAKQSRSHWSFALCCAFMALCAGVVVYARRRNRSVAVPARARSFKSVLLVLTASLLAGAALSGSWSLAYVASGPVWNLADTTQPAKVSNGQVVWKQSTQVSKTNSNVMADVQSSFDKWASVNNCTLAFTNAGTTTNTQHSSSDNVNFVAWDPNPSSDFSSATLAITYSVYTVGSPSYFIDCDIIFNDRDFSWGTGGVGNSKSVSLHEIGHFVGLAHTTNSQAVMYPYDQGYLQLSSDETTAAQTFYPGSGTKTPPPPPPGSVTAVVAASPVSGPAPLNVGFDGSASQASGTTISSYQWNYGDGASGSGQTASHSYTSPGSYTATLTVSDNSGNTSSATTTITVTSGGSQSGGGGTGGGTGGGGIGGGSGGTNTGTVLKGSFKLNFRASGYDSFALTMLSENIVNYTPNPNGGSLVSGTVNIAGAQYPFTFNPFSQKVQSSGALKVSVRQNLATIAITLKNVNLQSALATVGAGNESDFGKQITVPVTVSLNDGSGLMLSNQVPFTYYSAANKAGMGKY